MSLTFPFEDVHVGDVQFLGMNPDVLRAFGHTYSYLFLATKIILVRVDIHF
jgi:hypothetical protein